MITAKELDKKLLKARDAGWRSAIDSLSPKVQALENEMKGLAVELQKSEVRKEKAQMHEAAYLNTKSALDQFQFFADETNKATIQKDKAIQTLVTALTESIGSMKTTIQYFIDKDTPVVNVIQDLSEPVNESGKTFKEHMADQNGEASKSIE